jgi:hypothetical protein
LLAKIEERKSLAAENQKNDPKAKGGKAAPPPKKEEKAPAKGKKGEPVVDPVEEEERLRREAQEMEDKRIAALEANFNKEAELGKKGGKVLDFKPDADEQQKSQHYEWLVPMYFKLADKREAKTDVMYLSARTTCVRRTLIPNVEVLEFGEIPVLLKQTQEILVKNIGATEQTLKMEAMTPYGGFSVINALRTVKPGETKAILVQFEPFSQQIYEEDLKIFSNHTVVSVKLKGIGVRPEVKASLPDGLLSFGNVLASEQVVKTFNIKNVSGFPVKFELNSKLAGVENHSLLKPFTLIPAHG